MNKRTISFVLYAALLVGAFLSGVEVGRKGLLGGTADAEPPVVAGAADDPSTLPCANYQEPPKTLKVDNLDIPALTDLKGTTPAKVVEVVDGDTLNLDVDGKALKVRLVGMDTPEKSTTRNGQVEHFGTEASRHAEELIDASGREIYFSYDSRADQIDQYGRTLANVWVKRGERHELLNALMVQDGFAFSYVVGRKSEHADLLRGLMVRAREQNRGLWGVCN